MIFDLEKQEAATAAAVEGQMTLLPCISLWQPWAQWVILGWKPIETRTHARFETLAGQRIGIHASKRWDKNAIHLARAYLTDEQFEQTCEMLWKPLSRPDPGGKVLGTVLVHEHRPLDAADSADALIDCTPPPQRFGLILREPVQFSVPIPAIGRQGIFKVPLCDT